MSQNPHSPNPQQAMVAEFHRQMQLEFATSPQVLSPSALERRQRLIAEEFAEFVESANAQDLAATIKEVCDLLYVVYGTLVEMGVESTDFFAEVHRSNMSKVNGWRRADGKWMKPADYTPADIASILAEKTRTDTLESSNSGE